MKSQAANETADAGKSETKDADDDFDLFGTNEHWGFIKHILWWQVRRAKTKKRSE